MRMAQMALVAVVVVGCKGGGEDNPTAGTSGDPCDINPKLCATDGRGPAAPSYLDPVAVGFEIEAVLHDDGTLNPLVFSDFSYNPPLLVMTFADIDYFGGGDVTGHYCEALAVINPQPVGPPGTFSTNDGATLIWSYDLEDVVFDSYFQGTQCAGLLDPDVYGAGGELLINAFNGAHLSVGLGIPMSDRLWEAYGGTTATYNEDIVNQMFGMYVAINDAAGHWGGCDWTSARLFAVNDYDQQIEDPDNPGYLLGLDVPQVGTDPLPKGYLRTFAYWYQDFPLMSQTGSPPWDFSHLADDPVPGNPDCGDW